MFRMTMSDAAKALKISRTALYERLRAGKIKGITASKINGQTRYTVTAKLGLKAPTAEDELWDQLKDLKPEWARQVSIPDMAHRFDFVCEKRKLIIEIQGGVWINGAHTRGRGYIRDQRFRNTAQILGWIILEFSPRDCKVNRRTGTSLVIEFLESSGALSPSGRPK
ncbi:MAG: DUF559 domain-containing protein [Nitrososphaera sp.]|nr:DUF559 domain-containing protein [Nitrososphaera sp.]